MSARAPYPILQASRGWEKLCGVRSHMARGRTLSMLQGPLTCPHAVTTLVDAARLRTGGGARLVNYNARGEPFEHDVRVTILRDPSGKALALQATSVVVQPPGTFVAPSPRNDTHNSEPSDRELELICSFSSLPASSALRQAASSALRQATYR